MLEWIGDHWFQLLILAGLSMVILCLFWIEAAVVKTLNAINVRSNELLQEIQDDFAQIERVLEKTYEGLPSLTKMEIMLETLIRHKRESP